MSTIPSRYVSVDGIRTHYPEAGSGPPVVQLHYGRFAGAAEISWEFAIPALAPHFHVIAPGWLGLGRTSKIYDFRNSRGRVYEHLRASSGVGHPLTLRIASHHPADDERSGLA
jgi:hypothetical protein